MAYLNTWGYMIFIPLSDNTDYFVIKLALIEPMIIGHSSFNHAAAIVADVTSLSYQSRAIAYLNTWELL